MNLLLRDLAPRPQGSLFITVAKGAVLILLVVVAGFILFASYQQWLQQAPLAEVTPDAEREAIIATEGTIAPPAGKDQFNYGLDESSGADAEALEGHIFFTGVRDTHVDTSPNLFAFSAREPELGMQTLLPDYITYGAFLEADSTTNPSAVLLDAEHSALSQLGPNNAVFDHSVQKFVFDVGTFIGYDSITGEKVQSIDWSPQKDQVAYMRYVGPADSEAQQLLIQNWEVVISDLGTDTIKTVLKESAYPVWSPDGSKLLLMHPDGLYIYYPNVEREKRVVSVENGQFLTRSTFGISPDGTYLGMTSAKTGVLIMYKIKAWEPFELEEVGREHEEGAVYYYPQFSPDSKFYALYAVRSATGGKMQSSFEIRNVLESPILSVFDTSQFSTVYIDTWVSGLLSNKSR